jgi:hypothetical protein
VPADEQIDQPGLISRAHLRKLQRITAEFQPLIHMEPAGFGC